MCGKPIWGCTASSNGECVVAGPLCCSSVLLLGEAGGMQPVIVGSVGAVGKGDGVVVGVGEDLKMLAFNCCDSHSVSVSGSCLMRDATLVSKSLGLVACAILVKQLPFLEAVLLF